MMNGDDKFIYPNGIHPDSGQPVLKPISVQELASWIYGQSKKVQKKPPAWFNLAKILHQKFSEKSLGVRPQFQGLEDDPAQVGWGVIFAPDTPPEVRTAVQALADHRQSKWKLRDVKPNESAYDYRKSYNHEYGLVDPADLPYYVLLVGSPEQIPFPFQFDFDAQHAVGRLYFETTAEYQSYIERLIAYETAAHSPRARQVKVFSPENDNAEKRSSKNLAKPLAAYLDNFTFQTEPGKNYTYQCEWKYSLEATQPLLASWVNQDQPSLIFSASHGEWVEKKHKKLEALQGAIHCQPIPGAPAYLAGEHLLSSADLSGLVYFAFACYSAGTPKDNAFYQIEKKKDPNAPAQLAAAPFVACLPQRMLAQGALAYIGHVDMCWSYSFEWPGKKVSLINTFEDATTEILKGKTVGHAMESFNQRYLELHNDLYRDEGALTKFSNGEPDSAPGLVEIWTARLDARNYIVLGDPAAHLRPEILN